MCTGAVQWEHLQSRVIKDNKHKVYPEIDINCLNLLALIFILLKHGLNVS